MKMFFNSDLILNNFNFLKKNWFLLYFCFILNSAYMKFEKFVILISPKKKFMAPPLHSSEVKLK